ncbi:MAG: PAS domain S-box protein [Chitinophagaceae bacterium]
MSSAIQPAQFYPEEILKQIEDNLSMQGLQGVYSLIMQLPAGIAVFRGEDFIVQVSNETYLGLIGRSRDEFIGRSLFESVPELKGQQAERLLRNVLATGKPYRGHDFKASLIRDGKKEDAYFDFIYQALKNEDGTITGVIVVAYEVTESVHTKHLIAESERQFRNLVMRSPIAMTIFRGEDFIIELANEALLKNIWQREIKDVEGKKLLDVFPELNDQPFPNLLRKVFSTGITHNEKEAIAYVTTGKGEKIEYYFDFEYSPLFEADGTSVSGIMVTVIDVTEKVNARKKIEESEFNFRRIADNMPAMLFMSGKEGYFNYMNSQWYNYTGLSEEQSKGFGWLSAIHPDQRRATEKIIRTAIEKGEEYNIEFKLRKNDGSFRWFVTSGRQSFNVNNEPDGYLATLMDIHERKLADETLKESRESLKMAIETAELGTWDFDPALNQLQWDDRTKKMFGLLDDTFVTYDLFLTGIYHEDRERVNDSVNRAVSGENNGEYAIEYRVNRYSDNKLRWIRAKGKAFFNEKNQLQRFLGTVHDITEQKESVQLMEMTEARMRLATEETGTGVWDLNLVSGEIVHSPRMALMFGHDANKKLTHVQLRSQIHPDDLHEIVEKAFDEALQTSTYFYEARAIWPDNSIHWVRTKGKVIYDETNKPIRMLGVLQDITSEKQALILVQQSEIRYRQLIYSLPLAFYTCDKDGRIGIYNDAALQLWGRKPDDDDRWTGSYKIYTTDGAFMPASECPMAITLKTGKIVRGHEIIIERPDGTKANVLPNPQLVFDENGNITGGINMLVDISERKIAEQNTARLAAIVQSSDDAIISKTLDGIVRSWNPGAQKLFGYSAEEMIGRPIATLIPADRMNEENDIIRRIGRGEQIRHFETIRVTKEGKFIDISLTISPIRDSSGNITGASKIARDITTQKSLYKAIQESELLFKTIANVSPVGLWMTDKEGRNNFVNETWIEWTGVSLEEQYDGGWMSRVVTEDAIRSVRII